LDDLLFVEKKKVLHAFVRCNRPLSCDVYSSQGAVSVCISSSMLWFGTEIQV